MANLNVITGRVTNPGTTLTALTMDTGDSATVKSFSFSDSAVIIDMWGQTATPGVFRIRSPRLHDVAQGMRIRTGAAVSRSLLPRTLNQPLKPQDVLTIEGSGGGAETDVFGALILYNTNDLPTTRLISATEADARAVNVFGAEVTVTTSATAGQYGGSTALNATFDVWKRNVDYAIFGIISDTAGCTVGITGPDTGQTRIGMPMAVESLVTHDYFQMLSQISGLPLVPVINAANIATTFIDCATTGTGATANFTVILAELSGSGNAVLL